MYIYLSIYIYIYIYIYSHRALASSVAFFLSKPCSSGLFFKQVLMCLCHSCNCLSCTMKHVGPGFQRRSKKIESLQSQKCASSLFRFERRVRARPALSVEQAGMPAARPISLLTLSLLRLLDSTFRGNPLWAWEFHPFKLRLRLP